MTDDFVGATWGPFHVTRDAEVDAGYISFTDIADGAAVEQVVVERPGGDVVLDFDAAGVLLGVELLGTASMPASLHALLDEEGRPES